MFSRLQCVFIICMMAGRRAGPGFFSGLGNGILFLSFCSVFSYHLPPLFSKGDGWFLEGARAAIVLFGIHALFFPFYCCAVLGFAEYPCFDPGVWALKWADVDCLAAFHVYGEEGGGSGEGALCGTATHATLDGLVVN